MTLLECLVSYGVTKGVLLGDGIDSFRDFTPPSPDSCVVFHEYSGDPISPFTDSVHRSVQIKVRDKNAEAARTKALQVVGIFKSDTESLRVDFSNDFWGQVYIRQMPFKLDQDESDRVIYCFNLGITTNIIE
jgi:hypothetical protein